jgi:TusA-related sulfurtransferase
VTKIYLDAREMEHPKPLEKAIVALRELGDNEYFYMLHRKNPIPLISLAEGQNYKSLTYEESEGIWHILISRNRAVDLDRLVEKSLSKA